MADPGSPMAVLYVHSSAQMYGADLALLQLVAGLDRRRFFPIVAVPEDGPLVTALRSLDVETHLAPLSVIHRTVNPVYWSQCLLHLPRTVDRLAKMADKKQVRLVHSNTSHVLDGAFVARRVGAKHIWHVRELHSGRSMAGRVLGRLIERYADQVFVVSSAVRETFFPAGLAKVPIVTVYDGVDVERFHPANDGRAVRAEVGVDARAPIVAMVGRIAHWKGHGLFMEAAARIVRERPDVRFWIVGDTVTAGDRKVKAKLISRQWELGLGRALTFTGLRNDIPNVMAAMDVFVLPSQAPEPWGLVILEAMATGKPVIATRQGGPLEIIRDGETGCLVSPEDPEELADRIAYLLDHGDVAAAMGRAARAACVHDFAVARSTAEIMRWYEFTCKLTSDR